MSPPRCEYNAHIVVFKIQEPTRRHNVGGKHLKDMPTWRKAPGMNYALYSQWVGQIQNLTKCKYGFCKIIEFPGDYSAYAFDRILCFG